jgi:hypothetical protein
MGQKEGGERAGHRLHNDRICACHDRGKDGIHLPMVWWMGNISDAFAGVPCLTPRGPHASPYRLPTILLLAFSLSAVSHRPRQKGRRAGIMRLSHSRRRTAERSCLMRDTREMQASMGITETNTKVLQFRALKRAAELEPTLIKSALC